MFMQSLENHLNECNNRSVTENGAVGYKSTGKALLDLNFLTSSLRSANEQTIISKFDAALQENPELALKWLFFARDIRGGMGERRLFRVILRHLVDQCYMVVKPFLKLVPEYDAGMTCGVCLTAKPTSVSLVSSGNSWRRTWST